MKIQLAIPACLVAVAAGAPLFAAGPAVPGPMRDVIACRAVTDTVGRLACYDASVAAFAKASEAHEVVVLDADQVKRTRRSVFGLALPSLNIFGGDKPDTAEKGEGADRITDTIREAHQVGYGQWAFTLSDGVHWTQIDDRTLTNDPKPGTPIVIKRAAMGSYLANVGGQIAIRVRRVQ